MRINTTEPISTLTKMPENFEIIYHETAKEIFSDSWGDKICGEFTYMGAEGEDVTLSSEDIVKNIEISGLWGFIEKPNKINIWVDLEKTTEGEICSFFAHEIGHLQNPNKRDELAEEMKAERYSDVAKMAFKLTQVIREKYEI